MRCLFLFLFLAVFIAASFGGEGEYAFDMNEDGRPDKWYKMKDDYPLWEKSDLNFDGAVDFVVEFDEKGRKKYEEMDFNFDGHMDNFYYYEKGKATLQKIDTNYDGKIDFWIYLDGIEILRYAQDTDFDGVIDKEKMFGAP